MALCFQVQDALIRFIEPDMPGAYIRDSACYLQYLYAADQLTLNDSTFPSQPLWYDLLANIKLNDENRITTARGIPSESTIVPYHPTRDISRAKICSQQSSPDRSTC